VALHLAVLHPEEVASLVLADARVAALQPWPRDVSRLAHLPDLAGAAPLSPLPPARRPRPDRGRRRWRQLLDQTTARRDIAQVAGLTRERIAALGTESLLIYGTRSHCLPSCDGLGATLGRSRTVLVPDAGHFHPVERPVLFAREVQAFVRGAG
jgi:pimeloyl-ACP methyl ester carboxylesterase